MADNTLSIQLSVGTDGLVSGLKIAGKSVDGAAQQMRASFAGAASGSDGLTASLRSFKQEATQAARTANFYARDLASIIPDAGGATSAIKGVIAAALSGSAIGSAFALAVVAVSALTSKFEEQQKVARDLRQAHSDAAAQIGDIYRKLGESLDGSATKSMTAARQIAGLIRTTGKEAADAAREHVEEANSTWGTAKNAVLAYYNTLLKLGTGGAFSAEKIQKLLGIVDQTTKDYAKSAATIAEADKAAAAGKALKQKEEIRLASEAFDETKSIYAAMRDKTKQIDAAYEIAKDKLMQDGFLQEGKNADLLHARLKALDAKRLDDKKIVLQDENRMIEEAQARGVTALRTYGDRKLNEAAALEQQVAVIREQLQGQMYSKEFARASEEIKKKADEEVAVVLKANQAHVEEVNTVAKMEEMIGRIRSKASADRLAEMAKENQKWVGDFIRPLESSFAGAMRSMISQTKSLGEALSAIGNDMLNAIVDGLSKVASQWITTAIAAKVASFIATQGNIATAMTGAAAAMASIPIVGPGVSIAAALQEGATLQSMSAPYLASRGFEVPKSLGSGSMPVNVHRGELILTEEISDGLKGLISGGGSGGGIHLHFPNAAYVDKAGLQQLAQDPTFHRGVRTAMRNRSWPGA